MSGILTMTDKLQLSGISQIPTYYFTTLVCHCPGMSQATTAGTMWTTWDSDIEVFLREGEIHLPLTPKHIPKSKIKFYTDN